MIFQILIVCIGIRTVSATIDVTIDAGIDTYGITTCNVSRHIVTAIDIIDVTTPHEHTGRKACREPILQFVGNRILIGQLDFTLRHLVSSIHWMNVGFTATAIDIVNNKKLTISRLRLNLQQQTHLTCHVALVTATV